MAVVAPSSTMETLDPKPDQSETTADPKADQPETQTPEPPNPKPSSNPSPVAPPEASNPSPNPNPNPTVLAPPTAPSFTPSFRAVPPQVAQFSPLVSHAAVQNFQGSTVQNPSLQPPGVAIGSAPPTSVSFSVTVSGAGAGTVSVPPVPPPGVYYSVPGQAPGVAPRPYWQTPPPSGYMGIPGPQPMMAPTGMPRYPGPYPPMIRSGFPPRPPIGTVPPVSRPLVPGIGGVPIVPPVARPVIPFVAPTEKPQTTVYVGKIASTVENDFLLSLLRLCGPVKSWKRAQDPSNGTPRGFGFCEFESAEGVLRALRLLTKLNIDGQELVLNIKQATREYLERYVAKKTEREKLKETEGDVLNGESFTPGPKVQGSPKSDESLKKEADSSEDKDTQDDHQKFGIVTDEDKEADKDAVEKLKNMIEERLKAKPLPPPPPPVPAQTDGSTKLNSDLPSKSRDGESDVDVARSVDDKNEDDITSENKKNTEREKSEASSDKSRRRDRSRERDREHGIRRDKERELERYERERERERVRREREREMKIREAERWYKDRLKDWEAREREKDYHRQYEKEKEKEREMKRRREIMDQEDESDEDDTRKRRHRGNTFEEKRRKMMREKEDDATDRLKEEEEIEDEKKRALEEHRNKEDSKPLTPPVTNGTNDNNAAAHEDHMDVAETLIPASQFNENDSAIGNDIHRNGSGDESIMDFVSTSDVKQNNNNISSRKLGFGIMTSGKRTSVPSVFHEEDDEDGDRDKKMRPLVPIDYSMEELQAVQANSSGTPSNLAAAAEFAKRISGGKSKEEKSEPERERRNSDRQRERTRNNADSKHARYESREKIYEKNLEQDREAERNAKTKATETKKLLDAKQLIDMIPKTKEELFAYEINWTVYDKHKLQERMKPWITKKITEFLGEEEATLVDYIVSSTKDHVQASEMLQLLQPILDEEAEMFVLKMWRMLIFEIKKVETGLSVNKRS